MKWKQPAESKLFTYDFTDALVGRTIATVLSVTVIARDGVSALLTQDGPTLKFDQVVQVEWSGGVNGASYLTTVRVRDSQGEDHEMDGEILVSDVSFTVPVNLATTYLTADEYVARFGEEETVRLTDKDRKGQVDAAMLTAALKDATDLVEGYLGVRYPLPLTPVPPLVKGLVATLAREKLHSQRPTPQVTAEADRARSTLKDLSAGRMTLPDTTGVVLETTGIGDLASWASFDAVVFNAEKLDRF
jgi:phage gp36-like protein